MKNAAPTADSCAHSRLVHIVPNVNELFFTKSCFSLLTMYTSNAKDDKKKDWTNVEQVNVQSRMTALFS